MNTIKLKQIPCPKCTNLFPELRKTKYGYNVCVECSTVQPKTGVTTLEGTGDHTWNGLIIMDKPNTSNTEMDTVVAVLEDDEETTTKYKGIDF